MKPDSGNLALENSPVPDPRKSLEEIKTRLENEQPDRFILIRELKMVFSHLFRGRYYDEMQKVIEQLFSMIHREVRNANSRLVVIQIPLGGRFEAVDSDLHFAHYRLHELYEKLNIPYIDLKEKFLNRYDRQTIYEDFYIHRPDGSIGHLTKRGNQAVTEVIHQFLCERNLTPPLDASLSLNCQ